MSRIAYVNGRYLAHRDAVVHVEDRGYQFADGIYEVLTVWNGLPIDFDAHYERLRSGLAALEISPPMGRQALVLILQQMIRRNRIRQGIVYFQITRGVAPRNHPYPREAAPSLVVTARPHHGPSEVAVSHGVRAISHPDLRWARRDIKSISLLPNVMAKQKAVEEGAAEAILVDHDGVVTEGSSSNIWMVDQEGTLITHPLGPEILSGTVRARMISLAQEAGYKLCERSFTLAEALSAREVFLTSSSNYGVSIVQIDERVIGNGVPGSLASAMRGLYIAHMDRVSPQSAWLGADNFSNEG